MGTKHTSMKLIGLTQRSSAELLIPQPRVDQLPILSGSHGSRLTTSNSQPDKKKHDDTTSFPKTENSSPLTTNEPQKVSNPTPSASTNTPPWITPSSKISTFPKSETILTNRLSWNTNAHKNSCPMDQHRHLLSVTSLEKQPTVTFE